MELRAAGAQLEELVVYRNRDVEQFDPDALSLLEAGEIDWIGLSSPSIARALGRLVPPAARPRLGTSIRLASISPVTTAAAHEAGLPIAAEAAEHTWEGILQAIIRIEGQEG